MPEEMPVTDSRPRRLFARLLPLLLAATLAVGIVGCGQNIPVDPIPEKAMEAGKQREQAAEQAQKAGSAEASTLWTEAANYYAAVDKKFPEQAVGIEAAMKSARITDEQLKNTYGAWTQLRPVARQSSRGKLDEKARAAKAQAEQLLIELEDKQDAQNAKSPFFKSMDILVRLFGNNPSVSPVLAIFFIALFVTLVLWPLRYKTYRAAKEMQKYAPQIQELQKKYKENPMELQQKMREFQQEHGVNPMGGCLPALAQIPVFLLMIQLINNYQFHFRDATFLWINPSASAVSQAWPPPLAGAIGHHLGEQDLILLLFYAGTMFIQMKLTPPPTDPTQAEQQKMMTTLMPVIYFIMMLNYQLPSAFVLYYFLSNILSVGQQWLINRRLAAEMGGAVLAAATAAPAPAAPLAANDKLIAPRNRKKK